MSCDNCGEKPYCNLAVTLPDENIQVISILAQVVGLTTEDLLERIVHRVLLEICDGAEKLREKGIEAFEFPDDGEENPNVFVDAVPPSVCIPDNKD